MSKLLIANRGEIAIRVMRTARELGLRTVAVFETADAESRHAQLADEALPVGSYLSIADILHAARESGATLVHPGYGFLSERAAFAEACRDAGLRFVGPSPEAMRALGDKMSAKQLAVQAGVPIVPGRFEPGLSESALADAAAEVGYPVLLKASAGGGGRGMRVVREPGEFAQAYARAVSEATSAFGDGSMMVEKLIERPHHVEVQVLADSEGRVACLYERECSVQRRHQKLIEEGPSPLMDARLWARMSAATERLVHASGYTNAGTVEFIVDPETREFYFLEVNARLQVEHPVSEALTGLDLVAWQLRVALGERLTFEIPARPDRHAIEARIVAEDPSTGWLPSTGTLVGWAPPRWPGVRVDTGYGPGRRVPPNYDSLLAKVVAEGKTRDEALIRLKAALEDFNVLGVQTNIGYLIDVLDAPAFVEGRWDTGYAEREFVWQPPDPPSEVARLKGRAGVAGVAALPSNWGAGDGWRNVRSS